VASRSAPAKKTRAAARPAGKAVAKPAASRPPVKKAAGKAQAKPGKQPAAPKKAADVAADAGAELNVVRDGFTMPQADYDRIKALKALCLKNGVEVKKSALLRAGLQALQALPVPDLLSRIGALAPIKAGRKKKKD